MARKLIARHRSFWNTERRRSLYSAILLLGFALFFNLVLGSLASQRAIRSPYPIDLLLDILPIVDLDFIIGHAATAFYFVVLTLVLLRPQYLLFAVKAAALFIVIRAVFVNLTPLGLYPGNNDFSAGELGYRFYSYFNFKGNYFFSGHTGLPFLFGLVFLNRKGWRNFFFATSFIFGASVLLAHVHYSIDVFAAPFITYAIFKITQKLFPRDYVLTSHPNPDGV